MAMTIFTEADGDIWIETRREGVLAPVGHDLRLETRRFRVQITPDQQVVTATMQTASVAVRAALMGAHERPRALGRIERGRIERTVSKDVLGARQFPTIEFLSDSITATPTGYALTGQLTLRGVTRSVLSSVVREGARLKTRIPLSLSDFGVRPVTAFLGALRVRDEVCVVVDLPDLT
jgi:polyisoprenoid-binding protein YceI